MVGDGETFLAGSGWEGFIFLKLCGNLLRRIWVAFLALF